MKDQEFERLLLSVQKPGRYSGGEINSVIKDKEKVDVRFAFCFPDTYEIGMSHLGMKILYSQFNSREDIWCERVFAPWPDFEEAMRKNNIPLFALESRDSIKDFDFIGFNTSLEEFGRRNQVPQKTIYRAQSVFEELGVQCVLPKLDNKFNLSVAFEYAQEEETLSMSLKYDGEHFDVRNTPNIISYAIAENASESIEYSEINEDGFTNLVTVKIK